MRAPLVWLAVALCSLPAWAQVSRTDRILAVPAGKVLLDGDLKDWDLSAAIESAFDEALRPKFTVRLALMYDAQALYIAAHFVDETPLLNRHDPAVEPNVGWNADALQVRLCSDPSAPYPLPDSNSDRICHLTMWHFTDKRLPVLHIQYGMDYHGTRIWTGRDAGVAFKADKDGKGYTLEARVPWSRLNAPGPPKPGERIAIVFQPQWSDSTGWKQVLTFNEVIREAGFSFQGARMWGQAIFLGKGRLTAAERPRAPGERDQPLTLSLPLPDPQAKVVTAAVFDASGVLVRTLPVTELAGKAAGKVLQLRWDGLDDDGNPLPPGRYRVKVLTHRGVGQRYVASLHSAGNPPWRTDDGTGAWGGDHAPPLAACSYADRVYLGWMISEAGWAVIAVDRQLTPDGKPRKYWGQGCVLDIGILLTAMATDGERVFVAQDGRPWGGGGEKNTAAIVLWDAKTGRPINFPFGKRALVVSEWPDALKPPELTPYERLSIYHPEITHKRPWERFQTHDFGPQEVGLNLMGIAVIGDVVYASLRLENKIIAFNWRSGEKVAEYALPAPVGLAAEPSGTIVAVSSNGLARLNPATGQATQLADGLAAPWGVAVGPDGRIYVTDCGDAMCVRVFQPDGTPAGTIGKPGGRPWVGLYDPEGMLRPAGLTVDADGKVWVTEFDDTPRRVSVWSTDGKLIADLLGPGAYAVEGKADEEHPSYVNLHNTLFELDYATGKSRPLATLVRPQMHGLQLTPDGGFMGQAFRFRHHDGQLYLAHAGRGGVVIYRVRDFVGQPVSAVIPGSALMLHGLTKIDLPAAIREEFWSNPWPWAFRWHDENDDGLLQESEMLFERVEKFWGLYWGAWIDEDMTIWSARDECLWRVPVQEWRDGVPVYPRPSEQKPLFTLPQGTIIQEVMPDGECVYLLEQRGGDAYGKGAKWTGICRYTLDGRRQWAYRRVWLGFGLEAPLSRPGDVVGAMKFIGKATLDNGLTIFGVNGYFGQFNLLTTEGLWVASLCKDNRYGPPADENTVWPENFSGFLFRNRDDGRVYLMAGDTDLRVWEVTGLDTLRRSDADFHLSEADHQKAVEVAARRQGLTAEVPALRMARAIRPVTVDGDLRDWDMTGAAEIKAGARGARIALAYDDARLLVAFDVRDDSPMLNSAKDFALAFKSGDCCEVFLGTDASADPRRTRPVHGDVRLIFTLLDGQGACVLYQPVVREGERAPRLFSSPTGAEPFDRVVLAEGAQVAVVRKASGYVLEAAVPLAVLGWSPKPGTVLKGDVGVIYSDAGGSRNAFRLDYANKDTAIINDIPSEARLEPSKWGLIRIE